MSERIQKAEYLQMKAAEHRDDGHFLEAESALRESISLLTKELEELQSILPHGSEIVCEVAAQLADCWGSLGGILRRMDRLPEAVESYREGKLLEEEELYQIESTYNRVQWIVLSILNQPDLIRDSAMGRLISDLASIRKKKAHDAWSWADILLLAVLVRDHSLADEAFNVINSPSTINDVYTSGLPVFERLAKVLPDHAELQWAIGKYKSKIAHPST